MSFHADAIDMSSKCVTPKNVFLSQAQVYKPPLKVTLTIGRLPTQNTPANAQRHSHTSPIDRLDELPAAKPWRTVFVFQPHTCRENVCEFRP